MDRTVQAQHDASAHALAVHKALGVTEYNPDAALSKLRGLMGSATQTMLDIGETLILIRENETDLRWLAMLDTAGLERRMATRMMQAARKFRLSLTGPQQTALQDLSRGTMLELLVLDDEEIQELATGGTVAGLELDDVATMPTSTLRAELRKARAVAKEAAATAERLLLSKNEKIDSLETQVDKYTHGGRDVEARLAAEREANAATAMQAAATELLASVQRFGLAVTDCLAEPTETRRAMAENSTVWVFQRIAQIGLEHAIPVDFSAIVNPPETKA